MHWNIELAGKTIEVSLPDSMNESGMFRVVLQGKALYARYDQNRQTLSLRESPAISAREQRVSLRRLHVIRQEGETDRQVNLEFTGGGIAKTTCTKANAKPFIPGIVTSAKLATQKAQIMRSPMAGKVLKVFAEVGKQVEAGQPLLIIEAMKMENKIICAAAGKVTTLKVKEGAAVAVGQELLRIE